MLWALPSPYSFFPSPWSLPFPVLVVTPSFPPNSTSLICHPHYAFCLRYGLISPLVSSAFHDTAFLLQWFPVVSYPMMLPSSQIVSLRLSGRFLRWTLTHTLSLTMVAVRQDDHCPKFPWAARYHSLKGRLQSRNSVSRGGP